jgi:TetR/AcrR family transcriptional regulator, regulator of cefoperazone and chloramphenicol sensitivity
MESADSRDKKTKEKILKITIKLIKSNRISALTVRGIAGAADVNVGAINYYFGSKENLLHIAAKEILLSIKDNFLPLDDFDSPPEERLRRFLTIFTGNHTVYLDCIRWMVSKNDGSFKSNDEYSAYLKVFGFEKVKETMSEITGESDSAKLRLLAIQLLCAAVGPNIIIPSVCHAELPDIQEQIDILLTYFFNRN